MPQSPINMGAPSPRMAFLKNLERLLQGAKQAEVLAAKSMEDGSAVLQLQVDDSRISISVADVRLVEGSLQVALERPRNLRGRYNRVKNGPKLSVEELRERNLPLYWNEEWLRDELGRLGSYSEIAREHGYRSSTVASFAQRNFGMSVQKRFDAKRKAVVEEYKSGEFTQLELAEKHGVGIATVYRWIREDAPASRRRGRRPSNA